MNEVMHMRVYKRNDLLSLVSSTACSHLIPEGHGTVFLKARKER